MSVLASHRLDKRDVAKTMVYLADINDFDRMNRTYLEFFDLDRLPARTTVGVTLPFGALVEIDAWAWRPLGRRLINRGRRITGPTVPAP